MPPVGRKRWLRCGLKYPIPEINFTLQQHGNQLGRAFQEGLQEYAEDKTVQLSLTEREIQLPPNVKSTFLMIFSPDGEKVASTHGDHLIRISCVRTGRVIQILQGHKRTPWCLAFHPTLQNVIASGCLSGKVRVWDLRTGEFEEWTNPRGEIAIASLAFHPTDRVLLIATCNELHFWDWSHDNGSFLTLTTASDLERVRYVKFDSSGSKIVTGISNLLPLRPPPTSSNSLSFNPVTRHSESFDSSSGPSVSPSASANPVHSFTSMRRSQLISRVMNIYRQLESMIDVTLPTASNSRSPDESNDSSARGATNSTRSTDSNDLNLQQQPSASSTPPLANSTSSPSTPSTSSSSSSPLASPSSSPGPSAINPNDSAVLVSTFRRLHALCSRLAQYVQEQDSIYVRRESGQSSLVELLSRLEQSLRNISAASLASSEHMHQVHQRVTEILERMANVTSYRERLSSLRYQIYDAADRYNETDAGGSQRMDLIHCIWLIDVSLYLTRQMTRILEVDYLRSADSRFSAGPLSSHSVATSNTSPLNPSNSSQRFQPYHRSQSQSNFQFNIPLVRVSGPDPPEPTEPSEPPGQNGNLRHLWFQHVNWAPSAIPGNEFMNPKGTYRLQCWDFSRFQLPDLKDTQAGLVVSKCRIHNDASVDINSDGTLLASLVPDENSNSQSISLHIYSLEKQSFAQCLFSWTFGANAISVSLSPISRYVVVGFTNTRTFIDPALADASDTVIVGQVFRLTHLEKEPMPRLHHVRNISISRGDEPFNLNSIRWLPHPGQGFIYGTSRGHMVICRTSHEAHANAKTKTKTLSIGTQTTPS